MEPETTPDTFTAWVEVDAHDESKAPMAVADDIARYRALEEAARERKLPISHSQEVVAGVIIERVETYGLKGPISDLLRDLARNDTPCALDVGPEVGEGTLNQLRQNPGRYATRVGRRGP